MGFSCLRFRSRIIKPKAKLGMMNKLCRLQQQFLSKPKFAQEGLAVILLGFTSTALFMLVQVWLPNFGQDVLGLTQAKAVQLLSYYSIGSLISVILLAVLLNKVIKPITVMIIYPVIAALSLLSLIYIQQPFITVLSAFFIGLSTAGVFQLAMTIITEFFPANKGTITSYVNIAGSSAFIIIPFITGIISKNAGLTAVFLFDVAIAAISILLAVFVAYRYKKVIQTFQLNGLTEHQWGMNPTDDIDKRGKHHANNHDQRRNDRRRGSKNHRSTYGDNGRRTA